MMQEPNYFWHSISTSSLFQLCHQAVFVIEFLHNARQGNATKQASKQCHEDVSKRDTHGGGRPLLFRASSQICIWFKLQTHLRST
jgi:hypothetical protein